MNIRLLVHNNLTKNANNKTHNNSHIWLEKYSLSTPLRNMFFIKKKMNKAVRDKKFYTE